MGNRINVSGVAVRDLSKPPMARKGRGFPDRTNHVTMVRQYIRGRKQDKEMGRVRYGTIRKTQTL